MGSDLQHFRMKLSDDNVVWESVGFGLGPSMPLSDYVDAVYSVSTNHWMNNSTLQLNILDVKPSE
jgi:hypothetical protein